MEFLTDYGLFLAKTITLVAAILLIMAVALANTMKQKAEGKGHIKVTHLNKEVDELRDEIKKVVEDEHLLKIEAKVKKKEHKKEQKAKKKKDSSDDAPRRIYVLDFDGDPKASQLDELRQSITAVLSMINKDTDEVLLRLESPGGMVHAYGLAASQLLRIRDKDIPLTIAVDKVAASGGYMMACVASRLVAAPFAYIGSIGVLVQIPNFHRLLQEKHVDYEMVTAGEYKRTLTMFGENTEKGREKMAQDVEEIHGLFKDFINKSRPTLDIEKVATGETWQGIKALELGLIDEIDTSDELILQACESAQVYHVAFEKKKNITEKLGSLMESTMDNVLLRWLHRSNSKDDFTS